METNKKILQLQKLKQKG